MQCSYNIDRPTFCHNNLVDAYSKVAWIYSAQSSSAGWSPEICFVCEFLHCWNECELDVELRGILSGRLSNKFLFSFLFLSSNSTGGIYTFIFWSQIAKLSMIPVSCFLEVVFDHVRYSRDTKLSILLVLLGVAVCTVTDVSVNGKGFIAALVAVWSTALQQYVSDPLPLSY